MKTCLICNNSKHYMNANGDWQLCPRCDIIRLAKWLQEPTKNENKNKLME